MLWRYICIVLLHNPIAYFYMWALISCQINLYSNNNFNSISLTTYKYYKPFSIEFYKIVTKFATCFSKQLYLVKVSKLPLCFPTHRPICIQLFTKVEDSSTWRRRYFFTAFVLDELLYYLCQRREFSSCSFVPICPAIALMPSVGSMYFIINSFKLKFRISMDILYDS